MTEAQPSPREIRKGIEAAYRRALDQWGIFAASDATVKNLAFMLLFHATFVAEDEEVLAQVESLDDDAMKRLAEIASNAHAMIEGIEHLSRAALFALKFSGIDHSETLLTLQEWVGFAHVSALSARGKGRPKNVRAASIAEVILRHFEQLTGESADSDLSRAGRGGPTVLIRDVFRIFNIKATPSAAYAAALRQRDLAKNPPPLPE
jgi:hypothetical protein